MKGYWPSIIIMIGAHPNLVTTFRSFLYLISSEKSRVKSQVREIKIACLAAIYVPFPIEIWCKVLKFDDLLSPPPPYFNSITRCFTMCLMCLETRIFPCEINWNHKYHAYCVFLFRINICFWVLYVLMIKLVAMATILEGDVLQANYMGWSQQCVDPDM